MAKTKSAKPTFQTFNRLLNAETTDEILLALTQCCHEADDNADESLVPTLDDIQKFTTVTIDDDNTVVTAYNRYYVYAAKEHQQLLERAMQMDKEDQHLLRRWLRSKQGQKYLRMSPSEQKAWWEKTAPDPESEGYVIKEMLIASFYTVPDEHFKPITNYLLRTAGEPTEERLLWFHKAWLMAYKLNPQRPHPLAPIVKEWMIEQTTPLITREYERRRPAGVLATRSAARIRDVYIESAETQIALKAPPAAQLALPALEIESHLPSILPLEVLEGVPLQSRRGQISMAVRLFFENVMELKPTECKAEFFKYLGDLVEDVTLTKKVKQRDIDRVVEGIRMLDNIRIPYVDPKGGPGRYRPVIAWNEPMRGANKDFKIRFSVELPPDDKGGMLVEKAIIRELGKFSAPQFNAYLAACWLFNRYGRNPQGGLIDPTMPNPDSPRNERGALLHPNTLTPICDEKGKIVKEIYHPAAVKVLERVIRAEAKAYPILSDGELTRACYPGLQFETMPRNKYRSYKHKALQAWNGLEAKGYLRINKYKHGWQILPSDQHLNLHRALRKK